MTEPVPDRLDDEAWSALRAHFDEIGMKAVEQVQGVSPELAGQRVAKFNDMLIAKLKEEGWTP